MKTYKNDTYTRTVEVINTSTKCLALGWSKNVKVTTVYNEPKRTVESRYYSGDDYLSYEFSGCLYYTKRK